MADWRDLRDRFGGLIYIITVTMVISVLLLAAAAAHEWYPPICCSGGDCTPIPSARVKAEGAGGYVVDDKFHVERKDVRDSPDGQYHACFPNEDRMACFFAPPPGS